MTPPPSAPPHPQAKQQPNEFIVLNAAAYHCGYNLGFNCAGAAACCSYTGIALLPLVASSLHESSSCCFMLSLLGCLCLVYLSLL